MDGATQLPRNVDAEEVSDEDILIELPGEEEEITRMPRGEANAERRAFHIRAQDIIEHGETRGGPGCRATLRGIGGRPHTDTCRKRFEDISAARNGPRIERMMMRLVDAMQDTLEVDATSREPPGTTPRSSTHPTCNDMG